MEPCTLPRDPLRVPRKGRSLRWLLLVAFAGFASTLWVAGAAARSANVCGTLGLNGGAVRTSYHVLGEVAHEEGTPVCELETKFGKAYAAIYPKSAGSALHASWELGIQYKIEAVSGYGGGAMLLYTAGFKAEALGFREGPHFVWLTTGGKYMHAELLALAGVVYAKLL